MAEDILRDLAQLRQYGSRLQELLGEMQQAAPHRSEGTDPSGMVRAVLGPDGLPESIRVSGYWKEKLPPDAFAAAVAGACQAATVRRGQDWAEVLERAGWQQRLSRLDAGPGAQPAAPAPEPDPVPAAYRRGNGRPPRRLDALAEESISLLDGVMRAEVPPAPSGAGRNRGGTLEISLSPGGQVACRADPRWVAQQTGAQLSTVLSEILAGARDRLATATAAATAAAPDVGGRAESLIQELLGVMQDPERLQER
jgi:hypothetical protein